METSYKKVTQALNWLAKKEGGQINKMKAIKLIWMADRLHLREFGRPITNDQYFAMKFGPVGSVTRNITDEAVPSLSDEQLGYSKKYIKKTADNFFSSINDVDFSVFSESDKESLEKVYDTFGKFDQFELVKLTHEFPEWKKFESKLEKGIVNQAPMEYSDFFSDPENDSKIINEKFSHVKNVFAQEEGTIDLSRQTFEEFRKLQTMLS